MRESALGCGVLLYASPAGTVFTRRPWGSRVPEPVEAYFSQLRDIRASGAGVAEISYYAALKALLDEVGKHLKPKVTALMQLRNTGSGNPDGGLFTANQLKSWEPGLDPMGGQLPSRGAIEVKGTGDDVLAIAASEQVARYVDRYGLVLVTNLRDFVLVGRDASGSGLRTLESCRLAETDAGFWAKAAQPRKFAAEAGEGLTEFLRRVLLHNAPLTDPKDVAWFLASYARTARLRLEQKHELPALDALREQLEDSLGLRFGGERGDHFFRSTLVQTLFYGMFASWVLWAREREHTAEIPWDRRFQWETASATLHVPMVAELFYQFTNPGKLKDLGVSEVLEWAEEVIWRIDRKAFFEKFREEHAVQYFYEPFLEAFDPQLRKELGVWYTPDEVVKYMVARVDTVLREDLGIVDGFADPSVVVLDPCCGTGAYLVEVLRKIDETLQTKGADALTREDVKRAAMDRVIGFEIMPAPFVVAHLQLGILLAELGVPLRDADERAAVYLTNALTGWGGGEIVPPKDKRVGPGQTFSTSLFSEFAEERDAANRIKREEQILVVIGNPPYNGFAGVAQSEEGELIAPYKVGLASWGVTKNYLDDLYVRFIRLAERTISRGQRGGVACYISNSSWLSDPSAVVMRRSVIESFDDVLIDNLNGDSRETGKRTPEGFSDPSVFSGPTSAIGIQVGTAIATMISHPGVSSRRVSYRDFWGVDKRRTLAQIAAGSDCGPACAALVPSAENRFALRPFRSVAGYSAWPAAPELAAVEAGLGLNENRGGALTDSDSATLLGRMSAYFDPTLALSELPPELAGLTKEWARFNPAETRKRLLTDGGVDESRIVPFLSKPFDPEWAYAEPRAKLWNEGRAALVRTMGRRTRALLLRARAPRVMDGAPFAVFTGLADQHALHKDAYLIPMMLDQSEESPWSGSGPAANLSPRAMEYLAQMEMPCDAASSESTWLHVLAVGYSPRYQSENDDAIRSDWPRIPLPALPASLVDSAEIGRRVASLLDVSPRSSGADRDCLPRVGTLSSSTDRLDPTCDLALTAQWGVAGRDGITMPSTGKLTDRAYTGDERAAIAESTAPLGLSPDQAIVLLGETCFDVYLNDVAYWRCVPSNVWRCTIGGYQVIKKWLSYRERALLGRDLKPEEARYVTEMVRRIAALVLMQPELDANYERVKADVWDWNKAESRGQ